MEDGGTGLGEWRVITRDDGKEPCRWRNISFGTGGQWFESDIGLKRIQIWWSRFSLVVKSGRSRITQCQKRDPKAMYVKC